MRGTLSVVLAGLVPLLTGCNGGAQPAAIDGGNARRGEIALRQYACPTCHRIPGLVDADSDVGPPLTGIALRRYLAGRVPNTPENMLRWITAPESIKPGTAMPNLGVAEGDARDIAAYLFAHGS
jgi:cytochrome c